MAEGVQKIRAWFAAPMPPASPPDPQESMLACSTIKHIALTGKCGYSARCRSLVMRAHPLALGLPLSPPIRLSLPSSSAPWQYRHHVPMESVAHDDKRWMCHKRGDGLRDASMPRTPSNLASSLDEAPMVVYDITREGQT
eukprot:scaffold14413_cov23-Tisochrysis_lutea.AAC.1